MSQESRVADQADVYMATLGPFMRFSGIERDKPLTEREEGHLCVYEMEFVVNRIITL